MSLSMTKFEHTDKSFSEVLAALAASMRPEGFTLRELLEHIGERGLLAFCMILTIPFLLPVSIPGTSTPFGLIIALISCGVIANQPPWLPNRLMNRRIVAEHLRPALTKGAAFFSKIEKWIHPRLSFLTHELTMNRFNGIMMLTGAVLLMFPLPLPLANMLPAYGVLFLALGTLERDGIFILVGYLIVIVTIIYFCLLFMLGVASLRTLIAGA